MKKILASIIFGSLFALVNPVFAYDLSTFNILDRVKEINSQAVNFVTLSYPVWALDAVKPPSLVETVRQLQAQVKAQQDQIIKLTADLEAARKEASDAKEELAKVSSGKPDTKKSTATSTIPKPEFKAPIIPPPARPDLNKTATTSRATSTKPVSNTQVLSPTVKTTTSEQSPNVVVTIKNFAFSPTMITVKPGTKITWVNNDSAPHTVTGDSESSINSPTLSPGGTYSVVLTKSGAIGYHCAFHSMMKGTIMVAN